MPSVGRYKRRIMSKRSKKKLLVEMDEYGRTTLYKFALIGDVDGVKNELAKGADPNKGDKIGFTPLHISIQERKTEVVKLLLLNGADPNQKDQYGNSPLWVAVYYAYRSDRTEENLNLVELLIKSGADPNQLNNAGRSPIQLAISVGDEGLEEILKNKEA
jgi:ankyrin repeat protein